VVYHQLSSLILPWPADWAALFGADRPLILEIGFGYGHFLRYLSRQYTDHNIIGLEISNHCLEKVERALSRGEMPNVRVVCSMAETALHHLFTPASIAQIHVNFPDPWFKSRHADRRLMQRDTLDAMVSRLAPGGRLFVATDILDYAEMSAELLAETPGLTNTLGSRWVHQRTEGVITKYEARAQREGRLCYYQVYRRSDQPAPPMPPIEELEMPHLVMQLPLALETLYTRFEPMEYSPSPETHIKVISAFRSGQAILFELYVREPTIDQHIAALLVLRDPPRESPGDQAPEYTLMLSTIGNPRPTQGIHHAIAHLGAWLAAQHPETRILQNKLRE
jgi:tRNA (guanine-N7-)-methyltransferase